MVRIAVLCIILLFATSARSSRYLVGSAFVVGKSERALAEVLADSLPYTCFQEFYERHYARFEGVPYGAGGWGCKAGQTLVNLEQMDCVTFVENMLALALAARDRDAKQGGTLEQFVSRLNRVRYFEGRNETWEDRHYYFTGALAQLEQQGLLADIGSGVGMSFAKPIAYMSLHPEKFRGIRDWQRITAQETALTNAERYYVPIDGIAAYLPYAQTGDIVGLVTEQPGLDVSHCGFIHAEAGEVRLTHASSKQGQVVLRQDLLEYLAERTSIIGIVVYRPVF